MPVSQMTERQCLQCVKGNNTGHQVHIFRIVGIPQSTANGRRKAKHQAKENRRQQSNHSKRNGKDRIVLLLLVVHEAEKRRLHAERQNDEQQRSVSIQVCHHTIAAACSRNDVSIERHKQVVEKTPNNARQTIDGRVFCQSFQVCHSKS